MNNYYSSDFCHTYCHSQLNVVCINKDIDLLFAWYVTYKLLDNGILYNIKYNMNILFIDFRDMGSPS